MRWLTNPRYMSLKVVILLITLLYVHSYAMTYYVATNGNDNNPGNAEDKPFRTIQRAAEIVKAGDIVLVKQGTYPGFWIKTKHGQADAWIVFKPYPGHKVILDSYINNYANTWRVIEFSGCSYIEINGFEITDSNPRYDSDRFEDYSQGFQHNGIKLNGPTDGDTFHIRIINNYIYHIGDHGILASAGYNNEFINNIIERTGLCRLAYGTYLGGENTIIRGNIIRDNYGYGIHLYDAIRPPRRVVIENNILINNGTNDWGRGWQWMFGFGMGDPNTWNPATGIPKGSAILDWGGEDIIIRNNVVYKNSIDAGILVNALNVIVVNNTCYQNNRGIWVFDNRNAVIRNNITYANDTADIIGVENIQDHNLFSIDPMFVDAANGDFHLQTGSPAIDVGIVIPGFDTDHNGTPRPQGNGWDIGAYEFVGESSLQAHLNTNPTTGPAPLTVQFNGGASGGKTPYSFMWNFGDGNTANVQNPTHTYQQANSYTAKLTVSDSENKQASASRLILVTARTQDEPSVADVKFTEVDRTEELSVIAPGKWFDLYLYVDDPQGWSNLLYADIWLSHASSNEGTVADRGGRHFAQSHYVVSYSLMSNTIWAKETEGTATWTEVSGKLGPYVDDDNNEYEQNNNEKWAKARIKLLSNATLGNWIAKAYVLDKETHISNLFEKNFRVIAADALTASITLSDPSPTRAGHVQVTLTTPNVVTKLPTPLILTESDNSTTRIDLTGSVPGSTFTGTLVVDDTVADGPGHFSLATDALVDVNGNKGNEIKSGASIRIDKTPPANPQNVKVSIGPP